MTKFSMEKFMKTRARRAAHFFPRQQKRGSSDAQWSLNSPSGALARKTGATPSSDKNITPLITFDPQSKEL